MIHIGTSGWHYDHWRGLFYPDDVGDRLGFYARQFKSVEINNTFYRQPKTQTLRDWRDTVPSDFRFAVKASRYITHMKKLKEPAESLGNFIELVETLGDKLGPLLFQLPGNWHFNGERLAQFLAMLPDDLRCAFEFRDPSWHNQEVYALLARHNVAFCIFEIGGQRAPRETTADFVYIRLHGPEKTPYEGQYDIQALSGWAGAISTWAKQGKDVYCYFDNDQSGYAPQDARRLQSMLT